MIAYGIYDRKTGYILSTGTASSRQRAYAHEDEDRAVIEGAQRGMDMTHRVDLEQGRLVER